MTLFAVAAWITAGACVAMVGTLIVWLIAGRPSTEQPAPYLEPQPRIQYAADEEYIPAALCAPARGCTLTSAYLPADDAITVGYSEELIVGWELSEVGRCEN